MNQMLKPKLTVRTESSGVVCTIDQLLGGGGQGEVYRADLNGQPVALKWYFPAQATQEQRTALEVLVQKGPPTDKFLWPLELVTAPGVSGFGYIMPLRDPRYKSIVDLMKRRIDPTFRALATAGLELAHSFLQLHARGLCYRDISFGNVFFEPRSGDISIADNDNVTVNGAARGGVLGTPRFMAPEVVRGEALPSTQTDLFSLAVLLFYMFIVHHPLEGKKESVIRCFDLPAMTKLYGTEPTFIYDPADESNRPVEGLHDNAVVFWPIYPQFLRDLFTQAFTDGIRDPQHGRVRESEWRAAMVKLRDLIVFCPHDGVENFFDPDAGKAPVTCWSCQREIPLPPRIRIGKNVIMLNQDTHIYAHHTDDQRLYDFSTPVAAVVRHPTDPNVWGLRNLSNEVWQVTSGTTSRTVEHNKSVTIAVGTKIQFGKIEGEIRGA